MTDKSVEIFTSLEGITGKAELAAALRQELAKYSVFDLQAVSESVHREISDLPSPYREQVRPFFIEQLILRYCRIMGLHESGDIAAPRGAIKDPGRFSDYCRMAATYLPSPEDRRINGPSFGHFYFAVSAFFMFALDEPGHPEGTPFPGGFAVRRRKDGYYCPIRDKEQDVRYSICNFCPARQDDVS